MNEANMMGCAVQAPAGIVSKRIEVLRLNVLELNENVLQDIYNISDRLRAIGMRLNSTNHPDNNPKDDAKTQGSDIIEDPVADGVVGEINYVIRKAGNFADDYRKRALPMIMSYLSYVEDYI